MCFDMVIMLQVSLWLRTPMWDHWICIVVVEGSDEEMDKLAEEEEEEALALQKHMAASLEEQDFDVANFEVCVTVSVTLSTWIKGYVWEYTDFS